MVSPSIILDRLLAALPGSRVELEDTTGTQDHYEAVIVAPQFEGRTKIEQHKLVYAALGDLMGGADGVRSAIHALGLKTLTPTDAALEPGNPPAPRATR